MTNKILIAGVGGQGIVYLTNIIVEAAMISGVPVSVSEIHGLSQRGGVVTSGIGLGKFNTGFTGKANVDFLIGLEPLETQRCISYLHANSSVIFCNYRITPYSVNAETAKYPDTDSFAGYLKTQCREVVYIGSFPRNIDPVLYNIYILGQAAQMKNFPFTCEIIGSAIRNIVPDYQIEKSIRTFLLGKKYFANYNTAETT